MLKTKYRWGTFFSTFPHNHSYTLVRAWREYLGLTQREVAEKMGITQAALSQMESGEKKLRKATPEKLAKALGVGVEQLQG